jgi:RHS repeat-associated protein
VPASDAPQQAGGDIALAYYGNDLVRSITQGGSTTTFTLDAVDRRSIETVTEGGTTTGTVRHYTTPSDNPTWATRDSQTERYVGFLGESLNLIARGGAASTIMLSNPHGDVVATSDVTDPSTVANGLAGWTNYDEYGTRTSGDSAGLARLGWSGSQGRSEADTGLVLMGRRVYNPATGLFSSIDPIPGGNVNRYAFPTDPVNMSDLDGCKCKFRGKRIFYVMGEMSRSKWTRWRVVSWVLKKRTGVVKGIRSQSRTMLIIEEKCKRGKIYHRWAKRKQSRREYEFGVKKIPWLTWTWTSSWGWDFGWGAYDWTGDWYRA